MGSNNNQKYGAIIGLIAVIAAQIILRLIGVNKISTTIFVTALVTIGIAFSAIMIKKRKNKLGTRLSVMSAVLMLIACILNSATMVLIECYPQQAHEHKIVTKVLIFSAMGSFLALIIFFIIAAGLISKEK